MIGRVIRVSGMQHLVEVDDDLWQCELRGRLKRGARTATTPVVVGDLVKVKPVKHRIGVLEEVRPRKSKFSRLATGLRSCEQVLAANLDQLVVVASLHSPPLRLGFVDRSVVMALKGGIEPIICFNKTDLDSKDESDGIARVYLDLGYRVCCTSAVTGEGIEEFKAVLEGRISAVAGQSGVGKSSLLNRVDPRLSIKTHGIMIRHRRGRHTTTAVQLHRLQMGGYVADTPGIKEMGLWDVDCSSLVEYFVEMKPLAMDCQFRNCRHLSEPGCAIRSAVGRGEISPTRYIGYQRIMENLPQQP